METVIGIIVLILIIYGIINYWPLILICLVIGIIIYSVSKIKNKKLALEEQRRIDAENARLAEKAERERQEQEAKELEEQQLSDWLHKKLKPAINALARINVDIPEEELEVKHEPTLIMNAVPEYDKNKVALCQKELSRLKNEAMAKKTKYVSYIAVFEEEFTSAVKSFENVIIETLEKCREWDFLKELYGLVHLSLYQLYFLTQDNEYLQPAITAYRFLYCQTFCLLCDISVTKNYGSVRVPFDNENDLQSQASIIEEKERKIQDSISSIEINPKDKFNVLSTCFYTEMCADAEYIMWYYAKKKPFDTNKFERACKVYHCLSGWGLDTIIVNGKTDEQYPLSELIARIYVKKELGGEAMVESDKKIISDWIDREIHKYEENDEINCSDGQRLASALAWMGLYHIELDVLKQLVQNKVQLDENVQERLTFLSEGGTSSIKVYDVLKTDKFMFDSSSESWSEKDISICFRNIKMKKIIFNYSLVLSAWKKTIPLTSGQKLSNDQLYANFEEMVNDFDGEVKFKRINAKAVDLSNLEFTNAVLFTFTSERNRCVDILFHCEKFGRNLNITILILFTPNENLSLEEMEKYAIAIKSNTYVNSFRESILQVIDDTLKEKISVYENFSQKTNNVMFE